MTWKEKIRFVGMYWYIVESNIDNVKVKVGIEHGRCEYGIGKTLDEAIGDAARGLSIDWHSVERKFTEHEWEKMAHQ